MDQLHAWLIAQLEEKKVEPNSGLGGAISYLLKYWGRLTLFLRQAGAPIDNNICERSLKRAILHRKNSLFYKTENGAHVGDLFMGLLPDFRGRGFGERLLRQAIQAADAFGFRRIELGVFATNTAAAALYRKVGFVEEGTRRMAILVDGIYHDEIIMARLRD